jgi:hypothetical protein
VSGKTDFSSTAWGEYSAGPNEKDHFLLENIYGLLSGVGDSELLRYFNYIPVYKLMPDGRLVGKRRTGMREKLSIACFWLAEIIHTVDVSKSRELAYKEACEEVQKYAGKYYNNEALEISFEPRVFYKRKKNTPQGPWIARDPKMRENMEGALKSELADNAYKKIRSLHAFFHNGVEYSKDIKAIEKDLRALIQEDRLFRRVMAVFKESKRMTQRAIYRKLRISKDVLKPILAIMEFLHIIVWNRDIKSVERAWWDPNDKRKFIWLLASSFPQFGPRLEKDKIHKYCDYNNRAVEEWIRTGAAAIYKGIRRKRAVESREGSK